MLEQESIIRWLTEMDFQEYIKLFFDNGFDSIEVIKAITEEDLTKMGISKPGHRKKILLSVNKIAELLEDYDFIPNAVIPGRHFFFSSNF